MLRPSGARVWTQEDWDAETARKDKLRAARDQKELKVAEAAQKAYRPSQSGREFAAEAVSPRRRSSRTKTSRIPSRIGPLFEREVQKMREALPWRATIPEIRKAWRKVLAEVQEIADTQARDHGELTYKFDLARSPYLQCSRSSQSCRPAILVSTCCLNGSRS